MHGFIGGKEEHKTISMVMVLFLDAIIKFPKSIFITYKFLGFIFTVNCKIKKKQMFIATCFYQCNDNWKMYCGYMKYTFLQRTLEYPNKAKNTKQACDVIYE